MQILILLLLLLANGLFSMAEIAVVSSRKARLQQRIDEGDRHAAVALQMAEAPDEFLSTVQVGITLIGILAGAFGGATLRDPLAQKLATVPVLAPYANALAYAIIVILITFFSLVIGELVPKRVGLNAPEAIAIRVVGPMRVLSRILRPVVWLLTATSNLVVRVLRLHKQGEPLVTQAEIEVMLEQGALAGVLSETESEMAQSVFRLAERRVGALMTSRMEIAWLDVAGTQEETRDIVAKFGHSRYPLCDGNLDNVPGIVEAQQLLTVALAGQTPDLGALMRPPLFVPETLAAVQLLDSFYTRGQHVAIVVDEYGGTQGLITVHDLLEAVVGDVTEAAEAEHARAVRREDGTWLLDGGLPVEDFRELFNLEELPGEAENMFETLGGFVMAQLGNIPAVADTFEWSGYRFELLDMDGRRVDKVLLAPLEGAETTGE
ncbi:MAG: hemolysin family protein [Nitrososphaerales archaeon]